MARNRKGRGSKMGAANKKARENTKSGSNYLIIPDKYPLFVPEPETMVWFDFLPYEVKDMKNHPESEILQENVWYRYPYLIHRDIGPKKQTKICPESIGKTCPRCERRREIWNDPDIDKKEAKKKAKKFNTSARSIFIAKIKKVTGKGAKDSKKMEGKTCIFDSSDFKFFEEIQKEIKTEGNEDWDNFACLEGGYTIKVRFSEGTFAGNTFADPDKFDFIEKPRKDYPEKLLDKHPDLVDCIKKNVPTYQELVEMGKEGSDDEVPDSSEIEEMDYDELCDLVNRTGLDSEIDVNDFDEDEDEDLEAFRQLIIDTLEDQDSDSSDDSGEDDEKKNDSSDEMPDQDDLQDMDYDELCEVVEKFDFDIDPDDFDEDEDDEVQDFRGEILNAVMNRDKENSTSSSDGLEDLIDENEDDFKALKNLIKDNDEFEDLNDSSIFKKFKKKPEKLAKKMKKMLSGGGSKKEDKKKDKKDKAGGECPYGHKFGKEWGDHDDCEKTNCKSFKACFKKYDDFQSGE